VKYAVGFAISVSLACAVGCKKTPEPPAGSSTPPAPPTTSAAPTNAPVPTPTASGFPAAEITWVDPPAWKRAARVSPMRKATFHIPHVDPDKEDAELGVFYFGPGQGGTIDANVDRWVKQFSDVTPDRVKRADRQANGLAQHTVEIESGTFNANSMGMGQGQTKPALKTGYVLLGAIVEAPSGPYFFKITGPQATVAAARKTFYAFLDSIKSS